MRVSQRMGNFQLLEWSYYDGGGEAYHGYN